MKDQVGLDRDRFITLAMLALAVLTRHDNPKPTGYAARPRRSAPRIALTVAAVRRLFNTLVTIVPGDAAKIRRTGDAKGVTRRNGR